MAVLGGIPLYYGCGRGRGGSQATRGRKAGNPTRRRVLGVSLTGLGRAGPWASAVRFWLRLRASQKGASGGRAGGRARCWTLFGDCFTYVDVLFFSPLRVDRLSPWNFSVLFRRFFIYVFIFSFSSSSLFFRRLLSQDTHTHMYTFTNRRMCTRDMEMKAYIMYADTDAEAQGPPLWMQIKTPKSAPFPTTRTLVDPQPMMNGTDVWP